jgi:hypothetical protein
MPAALQALVVVYSLEFWSDSQEKFDEALDTTRKPVAMFSQNRFSSHHPYSLFSLPVLFISFHILPCPPGGFNNQLRR